MEFTFRQYFNISRCNFELEKIFFLNFFLNKRELSKLLVENGTPALILWELLFEYRSNRIESSKCCKCLCIYLTFRTIAFL